jgi:hypothetical protein
MLTAEEQKENARLQARIDYARSAFFEAKRTHGERSREAREAYEYWMGQLANQTAYLTSLI